MKDLFQLQGHSNRFAFLIPSALARWAPIPLRLIVGYGFMEHGFAKLSRGPDAFATILQAMGVPHPHLMGHYTDRTARGLCCNSGCARGGCQCAHGGSLIGGHV